MQFEGSTIEFTIFPSRRFRFIHPKLLKIIRANPRIKFAGGLGKHFLNLSGYFDFILFEISRGFYRSKALTKIIKRNQFDYVHALEIQGAGYLTEKSLSNISQRPKLILTNWGSDIFYFQSIPEHLKKIKSVLKLADYYSAECQRDYSLAKLHGYTGIELPCIPNAGGFDESEFHLAKFKASDRSGIVVKTYGGLFGRGDLAIQAISDLLPIHKNFNVFFYSVTEDLEVSVLNLKRAYPERVKFSTLRQPLAHENLREIFLNSRVYLGCSISDGLSTSFLEALAYGAYPIQTNTSCADELISKGAIASLIPLELNQITETLESAILGDELVDLAHSKNLEVVKRELNSKSIKEKALKFYE
jgi:glycosyltransferase involved in cell wall biosynthesis